MVPACQTNVISQFVHFAFNVSYSVMLQPGLSMGNQHQTEFYDIKDLYTHLRHTFDIYQQTVGN